ncbi:MAG: crosslink repair DNA glycosylase YcaQ family protein [Polyangiales bacterium]
MPSAPALSLASLRRHATRRTLFAPVDLAEAMHRLAFVQADPIRAPARAQDLTLRHRVRAYRAGDLELHYPSLDVDEGYFVNYGFLARDAYALLHPRAPRRAWTPTIKRRAEALLAFAVERGLVRPRDADAHFAHGRVTNYWGGLSSATTHLLDAMHYRGLLRVAQRERGVRIYAAHVHAPTANDAATRRSQLDALVDIVVRAYAPLPAQSLSQLTHRIRYRTPARAGELRAAVARAKERLAHARVDGIAWYWPADEQPTYDDDRDPAVSLLAPFDPIVWDRRRFEVFWGWAYRFEAYTPALRRKLGYYALPLLYRDQVIGWGNVKVHAGRIDCQLGFVDKRPRDIRFRRALDDELARLEAFLG